MISGSLTQILLKLTTIKILSGLSLLLFSCHAPEAKAPAPASAEPVYKAMVIQQSEQDTSWGYIILCNNRKIIQQFTVPVIEGSKRFSNRVQALQTGRLVATKLNSHQSPRISKNELDSMGITLPTHATEKK